MYYDPSIKACGYQYDNWDAAGIRQMTDGSPQAGIQVTLTLGTLILTTLKALLC